MTIRRLTPPLLAFALLGGAGAIPASGRLLGGRAHAACSQSADPGPPAGEPLVQHSHATELVSGLFLDGGPLRRAKRCRRGTPAAGTITVTSQATGKTVADDTLATGRLARIRLAPGTYTIAGTFADAFANGQPIQARPRTVTIAADTTVRQDVAAPIK
jgi:hypothetical protein